MSLNSAFKELIKENNIDKETTNRTIEAIVRKLNCKYYGINSETRNRIFAGSYGRNTCTDDSDIDLCFILPPHLYDKFENRSGNGESQLLSDVTEALKERYPNSTIKGDGQVVVVAFNKRTIEILPSFYEDHSSFLVYPDSHNGGSWRRTNPLEQQKIIDEFAHNYPIYRSFCKILRCWRDENNVHIKGIEIDMLVMNYLRQKIQYFGLSFEKVDILALLKEFFDCLSENYSIAIPIAGDNDLLHIKNSMFLGKAKKARQKLEASNTNELWDNCIDLFGNRFPANPSYKNATRNEQFIQQLFPVRCRNHLKIDCEITSDGFRVGYLRKLLASTNGSIFVVKTDNQLKFKISECDVDTPYDIYWKVRNVGKEAIERDDIRGEIVKGEATKIENSIFHGPHYVECFIVKNGICVAKDRIPVPIEKGLFKN